MSAEIIEKISSIDSGRFRPIKKKKLERGTHGTVLFCEDRCSNNDSSKFAIKCVVDDDCEFGMPVHGLREIAAYKRLGLHKNILEMIDVLYSGSYFFLMEIMDCTLKVAINAGLTLEKKTDYKKQLLQGISWCHKHKVMHRDIKPQNILLNNSVLKIADFGLAKLYSDVPTKKSHSLMAVTLWYRAIEILLGQEYYNQKIDIWSVACVFYEMDFQTPLFSSDSEVDTLMKIYGNLGNPNNENFPGVESLPNYNSSIKFNTTVLSTLEEMYKKMLCYDYMKRPGADELLKLYFNVDTL